MSGRVKLTFAIQKKLKIEVQEKFIKEGYGLRGKSKWISEALEHLLSMKNFPDLVSYNDEMSGFDELETVVLDYKIKVKLEESVIEVRKKYPSIEGVKSRILRTAILQRLLRS